MTTKEISHSFNQKRYHFSKNDGTILLYNGFNTFHDLYFDSDGLTNQFKELVMAEPEKMLTFFAKYLIHTFNSNITNKNYTLEYHASSISQLKINL